MRMACRSQRSGADNRVTLKPVTIARDLGKLIEIGSGLAPSDRVIESPPDGVANGAACASPPQRRSLRLRLRQKIKIKNNNCRVGLGPTVLRSDAKGKRWAKAHPTAASDQSKPLAKM